MTERRHLRFRLLMNISESVARSKNLGNLFLDTLNLSHETSHRIVNILIRLNDSLESFQAQLVRCSRVIVVGLYKSVLGIESSVLLLNMAMSVTFSPLDFPLIIN